MTGIDMTGERKLWAAVVSQGIRDLCFSNNRNALIAAMYFFTGGYDSDTRITTFNGVCMAYNIDPNKAAKRIWDNLKPGQQERILRLLRKAGYTDTAIVH